ncbi:HEAT repeat domain-containing protein [Chitinophaga japonensis]|uniref:HEAT repeat protein n=1 Tax=Chitinophaga japonensis TaxID=104662 RepID=A0A562TDK1_CHIJA|nr:HEAT repeat domain-containing protein [Chitinophaga japonensis]TWI91565.1 HEAT repeat protein [Chitinophaga japonensis]
MPSFKTDESFLEKISLGAIGTQRVFHRLFELGHKPIELERGSMNYKIWKKIKIKRIRVPDIICVNSGIRIESRAKSKLEITMSHSLSDPERGWDAGLKDEDFVALIGCKKGERSPIDWQPIGPVQFISVKELRDSYKRGEVVTEKPKGAQEGSEVRVTWPSCIAKNNLRIEEITEGKITGIPPEGRRTLWRLKKSKTGVDITLKPLVQPGQDVLENQIIAATVSVYLDIPQKVVDSNYFINNLTNLNHSERYAAAKALRYFEGKSIVDALKKRISDSEEHIYIQLEAAASLAILGNEEGFSFIERSLKSEYLQHVLETVIVLAEVRSPRACELLCEILLNDNYDAEIRAGAAWALGEQKSKGTLDALISSFNAFDENIRIEAARALAKMTQSYSSDLLEKFADASPIEKPGVAWALTKSTSITLDQLLASMTDTDSRHWITYILGIQGQERYIQEIEKIMHHDSEVYFAVTLLWKITTSWIHELKEY